MKKSPESGFVPAALMADEDMMATEAVRQLDQAVVPAPAELSQPEVG